MTELLERSIVVLESNGPSHAKKLEMFILRVVNVNDKV